MSEQPSNQEESQVPASEAPGGSPGSDALAPSDVAASSAAGGGGAGSSAVPSDVPSAAASEAPSEVPSAASTPASEAASPASTQADAPQITQTGSTTRTPTSQADSTATIKSHRSTERPTSGTGARSKTGEPEPKKQQALPARGTSAGSQRTRKRMKLGELDLATAKIGFLGAGKMAESTINGLIHYAKISPSKIHVAAPSSKGLERFKALGCKVTKRNYDIFGRYDCDIIFLCFHGYVIKHCYKLGGARPHPLTTNYIPHQRHPIYILSLVSGVSLSQIKACLLNPDSTNRYVVEVHRVMMNTAVGHGLGICAVDCEPDSRKLSPPLRQLLSSIAQLEHVPASQMDAACAIGGSGLAFSYYFINALADGAFKMGLSRQQAIRFASKTAQCAAQTMLESGKHPAELRDTVSAPSGAAIYGIHVLEKNDVASGVTAAVEAAHKRANDLATQEVS